MPLCAPSPVTCEIQVLLLKLSHTICCSLIYETLHHSLEVENHLKIIIAHRAGSKHSVTKLQVVACPYLSAPREIVGGMIWK